MKHKKLLIVLAALAMGVVTFTAAKVMATVKIPAPKGCPCLSCVDGNVCVS